MAIQIFRHGDRLDRLLVPVDLAQQEVDPVGPLEPPVAEQLGVVGGDDERRAIHGAAQPFDLLLAVEHEVAGVLGRLFQGGLRLIGLPCARLAAGDLVILDAQVAADADLVQVRPEILVIQIEADVAVELAILVIAGIAFDGAPDLLGRFGVAARQATPLLGQRIGA